LRRYRRGYHRFLRPAVRGGGSEVLTGRVLLAEEMKDIGFLNDVVPADQVLDRAEKASRRWRNDGRYVAAPKPAVLGHGIRDFQQAMDIQRKGVSAAKVVVALP
jgi:enoyl-CoA hydratase/carnithine racemase